MNYKKIKVSIYCIFSLLILLPISCIKDDYNEARDKENLIIDDFFKTHDKSGYTLTPLGYYYKQVIEGDGIKPSQNSFVIISYNARYLENMRLYDTSDKLQADTNYISSYLATQGPLKISLFNDYRFYAYGVCDALLNYMKEGGRDSLICPGNTGITGYIPSVFDVTLLKVINDNREFEKEQITRYFTDNNIQRGIGDTIGAGQTVMSDTTGFYVFNNTYGTDSIFTGDSIEIKYSLTLLPFKDDKYLKNLPERNIYTNRTIKLKLGTTSFNYYDNIPLDYKCLYPLIFLVQKLKKNGIADVIVPFHKGYGNFPLSSTQLIIPQYSTLLYHIEIIKVKKNPA